MSEAEELSRLRSDEWLERAAEEIHSKAYDVAAGGWPDQLADIASIATILRKHRDGHAPNCTVPNCVYCRNKMDY